MSRKVFFSFHYERDAWRAGQVRNCNVVPSERQIEEVGFIDAVDWESIKKQGKEAIKRWIDKQLIGTTVTAVLIGAETATREWVQHEILTSWNRGNGIVGIWIHNVKDTKGTDVQGSNPFDDFKLPDGTLLSAVCKTYDWVLNEGRQNIGTWADEAAKIRAKYGADDKITFAGESAKADDALTSAAVAVGAVALGTLAAKVLAPRSEARLTRPAQPSPQSFSPRAPWCSTHDHD
jgi:hypothetical protein